ncbi:MAG: hypothetical protein QGM50_03790 [Anaerolineae bacterium]|nr:hypothetical protein [Anaerolineae bacterium]MDK1117894.1 hypothetical protein [Anaerolineae bacterium]
MRFRLFQIMISVFSATLITAACSPKVTPPPVDIAGTIAVQLASEMLTQISAAYSPTPPPSPSPLPVTDNPIPADTATPEQAYDYDRVKFVGLVKVVGDEKPPCTTGPSGEIQSYISVPKKVGLLGVGSVPGWYVISNPYFGAPCWLPAERVEILELNQGFDLTSLPVFQP